MSNRETIVRAASAYRQVDPTGALRPSPAWADLEDTEREEAFRLAQQLRTLESLADEDGLNSTVKAVLQRIS